jgi:uncharacterized Zn-binding protein involved in type VI secretion
MGELVSVQGDENSHVGGALHASNNSGKVWINGKKVVYINSTADGDLLHPPPPTDSLTGSSKVFCEGIPIHRNNDLRVCGATTVVTGQTKVFAG